MSNTQGYINSAFAPAPGGYPPQQQSSYPPQQTTGGYPPQQAQGGYPPQQQPPAQQSGEKVPWTPPQGFKYQGEIPDHDVSGEASRMPPAAPSVPDQHIAGYENVAYSKAISAGPPPAYTEAIQDTTIDTSNLSSITEEEAKEALQEYVSQQCCYGSKPAKEMKIKDIASTSAFHYSLETFTESRNTKRAHVPYSGGPVDGPYNGPAPSPWNIPCSFAETFKNQELKIEVPHTAFIVDCHVCLGAGFERCNICHGRGRIICPRCSAKGTCTEYRDGQEIVVICTSCNGSGRQTCNTCSGSGCIQCRECKGFCQLKQYIELTVSFTNRMDDHIVEKTDMPDHLVREAIGDTLLEQVAVRVGPVVGFFENEINERSHSIVQMHATQWPNDRIIQQRQILRAVPVYECRFKFDDKEGRFWIYGKQKCVFTNDYPHTCCCCKCTIL